MAVMGASEINIIESNDFAEELVSAHGVRPLRLDPDDYLSEGSSELQGRQCNVFAEYITRQFRS